MSGLQCHKRLWLQINDPLPLEERETSSAATWGTYVGEKARDLFPDGVLIPAQEIGRAKAVEMTAVAFADPKTKAIFEATFVADGVQVRVDVLERAGRGWILNEVKSATSVKEEYIPDAAVQLHVLRAAGVTVKKVRLWHIDNTYVRGKALDLDAVFAKVDVTRDVESYLPEIPKRLAEFQKMLARRTAPEIAPSGHCSTPYECEFWDRCTAGKPDDWVLNLPGRKDKLLAELGRRGIDRVSKIPDDVPMTANQTIVRDVHRSGKPWISERLPAALKEARGPCVYMDFETFAPALPLYEDTSPYQALPFQWSLHIRDANGKLTHTMFLAPGDGDPRRAFAESLIAALSKTRGKIIVYSSFERTVLGKLKAVVPAALGREIDAIIDRLFDLLTVVRQNVYMTGFRFSNSIKTVGPTLAPNVNYDELEIADGTAASDAFARIAFGMIPDSAEISRIRTALERYCALDTEALAGVHLALEKFAFGKER